MAVRIFAKYRCMTCPGTPWLTPPVGVTDDVYAQDHLTENIGHELASRVTSEIVPDPEPEGGEG